MMMILTMKVPEAPTASTSRHNKVSADTICSETNDTHTNGSGIRCTAGSSNSLTSSCSDSSLRTMSSDVVKVNKRVCFCLQQTAYFSPKQILSKEERKSKCWYSEAELSASRDEARMAIQVLHHQLLSDAATAINSSTINSIQKVTRAVPVLEDYGSWVLRCPEDETKIVCLRGIEKYADAAAKFAGQKHLVHSVLHQQSVNKDDIQVSMISQTLSKPFTDVARHYAMKYAEELYISTKLEEEQEETERRQREEVATVLLLIMRQENNQYQQKQVQLPIKSPSHISRSKVQETSPIVTPHGSISRKRASLTSSPLSETRSVKPCVGTISDRVRG